MRASLYCSSSPRSCLDIHSVCCCRRCSRAANYQTSSSALDLHLDGQSLEHSTTKELLLGNTYFASGHDWQKAMECYKRQLKLEGDMAEHEKYGGLAFACSLLPPV